MQLDFTGIQAVVGDSPRFEGNRELVFSNLAPIGTAGLAAITWLRPDNGAAKSLLEATGAGCVICNESDFKAHTPNHAGRLYIITDKPQLAFYKLLKRAENEMQGVSLAGGDDNIHPTAIIHQEAKIGTHVRIGAYCIIGACEIGDGCVIHEHVKVYAGVRLEPGCTVREFCSIGGAGFGIVKNDDGLNVTMPHIGTVTIGKGVTIFPFSNVDRPTMGETFIGTHAMIDHYCHIGHNTTVGRNAIITAQTVLAGGSSVGDESFIGVNTIIKDKVKVGSRVMTGMGAVVTKDIPDGETWVGNPAREIEVFKQEQRQLADVTCSIKKK